ncbi:MAG: hypothetical protein WCH04_07210 [Gammaproteobacteria bacterium]
MEERSGQTSNRLNLIELYSVSSVHRILLPGYVLRADLPGQPDFFKAAQHYLG